MNRSLLSFFLLIVVGLILLSADQCYQTRNSFTDDDIEAGGGSLVGNNNFAAAVAAMDNNCSGSSCHGSGSNHSRFTLFTTQAQFIDQGLVVNATDPCSSFLIQKLRVPSGGSLCSTGNGNMPSNSTLSLADYNAIRNWVLCINTGTC